MRKIAVLSSGNGEKTSRLISLFNEGNRFRISLVLTDRENDEIKNNISDPSVNLLYLHREIWSSNPEKVIEIIDNNDIDLIAIDDFREILPLPIQEKYEGRIVLLTSPEEAPREVVAAFNKMDSAHEAVVQEVPHRPKSADEEWADVLKIKYDESDLPTTPPPVPENNANENISKPHSIFNSEVVSIPLYKTTDLPPALERKKPASHLVLSIVMAIFFSTLPAIIAIIFASQVNSKFSVGDYEGAERASRNADIWIIISFVIGIITATIYLPIMLVS